MAALSATIAGLADRAERARTRGRVQLAEPRNNMFLQRATEDAKAKQQREDATSSEVHQWWTDTELRMLLLGGCSWAGAGEL